MTNNNQDELTYMPRKLSYISATMRDQTNVTDLMGISSIDTLKAPASEVEQTVSNEAIPVFSIRKTYKNLILLSVAFVLLFTAYNGMIMLQSSLNVKNNVGVNSLMITHAFVIVSS